MATVVRSIRPAAGGTVIVHVSASSKCVSPWMGTGVFGGTGGKKACASTPLTPSNAFVVPSPWSPATKRMMISGPLDIGTSRKLSPVHPAQVLKA
jgi:hypothetical protein